MLVAALFASASVGGVSAQQSGWRPFVSVSPFYESSADLDRGGDFSVRGVLLRAGAATGLGAGNRIGVTLNYDYYDSSFSNPVSFGGVDPWNTLQRFGATVPMSFAAGGGWTIGIAPSADWFKENGAKTSDSLVWGATFSASRSFGGGNRLGIGVGAFDGIEDTNVFPLLIVDWRLGERWRLINPLAGGPTGPAGIELDYQIANNWSLGVGAAYRNSRFRLSENGPVRNGIGEITGVPVFLRSTHNLGDPLTLHVYLGAVVNGRLRVESSSGNLLREDDFDTGPLFGLTVSGRF